MQQDERLTSAEIRDQIIKLKIQVEGLNAGMCQILDERGYTEACRRKTIQKLESILSDAQERDIKKIDLMVKNPKTAGQLNTHKIYREEI